MSESLANPWKELVLGFLKIGAPAIAAFVVATAALIVSCR
jgi:hypothetical protein